MTALLDSTISFGTTVVIDDHQDQHHKMSTNIKADKPKVNGQCKYEQQDTQSKLSEKRLRLAEVAVTNAQTQVNDVNCLFAA